MRATMRATGRAMVLVGLALVACGPPNWRYLVTLAPPPTLPALPDGHTLALSDPSHWMPTAAVGKIGSTQAVDVFGFTGGTWSFAQRLVPRPGAIGQFATAVGLSGSTLAIGAPHDDPQKIDNGYVDVYTSAGGPWVFQQAVAVAYFTSPPYNTGSNELGFGRSLDLAGDDLVVGAGRFAGGYGRAFVFHRAGGVYVQVAELMEATGNQRFDANFGDTVRIDGDTLIATRPDTPASTPPPKAGKVYVYERTAGGWTLGQVLQSPTAGTGYDGFGTAAALAGNLIAVRGPDTVWVFARSGGVWNLAWSTPAGPADRDSIGLTSGFLAVGEPAATVGGAVSAGQVRVFVASGTGFAQQVARTEPTPGAGHAFGARVALRGDQLLVGAPGSLGQPTYGATLDFINGPY